MSTITVNNICEIKTASNDKINAYNIAKTLLTEKLIVGAQITRVKSLYVWDNKIEEEYEWLVVVKTTMELKQLCVARILELHTYKVPEIVVTPITETTKDFAEWIMNTYEK